MKKIWTEHWGGDLMIVHGKIFRLNHLDGFIAEKAGEKQGLITFQIGDNEMEITSLNSFVENRGIGTSLVHRAIDLARNKLIRRIKLTTTNSNINALRFWQKREFHLFQIYPGAVEAARKQKPGIPLTDNNGIPIRDEIELEMVL
jgi:ribosomal protein S18 acetylase RimI-like enzyme